MPCLEIARAVTATGRWMIETCRQTVEKEFAGCIVRYGDTDSVFMEFDTRGIAVDCVDKNARMEARVRESYRLGRLNHSIQMTQQIRLATDMCTALFPAPIRLELEKVLCPTVMAGKKNYSAGKWTDPGPDQSGKCVMLDDIVVAGMRPIRRDTCDWVRKAILGCLTAILKQGDVPAALNHIRTAVADLLGGKVRWTDLAITKSLAKGTAAQNRKRTLMDAFAHSNVHNREKDDDDDDDGNEHIWNDDNVVLSNREDDDVRDGGGSEAGEEGEAVMSLTSLVDTGLSFL